jgi:hypothetical protein|tara:strand:- start:16080 stop:16382 length:303 start_codon:yes stop_codon:yes gene_type:complete
MAKKKTYEIAELSTKKVVELHKIASSVGIKNVKKHSKAELLKLIVGKEVVSIESKPKPKAKKVVKKSKPKAKKVEVKVEDKSGLVKFHRKLPKRSSMTWR